MSTTTLFLHFGAHKTATTSIQTCLRQHQDLLRENDVTLITNEYLKSGTLLQYLRGQSAESDGASRAHRSFLETAVSQGKTSRFLISHESFFSFPFFPRSKPIYPTMRDALRRFRTMNVFDEVRGLFYLRDQVGFLQSLYLQNLGNTHTDTFESFFESMTIENLNWTPVVEVLEEAEDTIRMTWKLFEKIHTKGPRWFIQDYFRWLGVDLPPEVTLPHHNDSLSGVAARMLQVSGLNEENSDPATRKTLRRFLKRHLPAETFGKADTISSDLRTEIRERLLAANSDLFKRLFKSSDLSLWGA